MESVDIIALLDKNNFHKMLLSFDSLRWPHRSIQTHPLLCVSKGWRLKANDLLSCGICQAELLYFLPRNHSKSSIPAINNLFERKLSTTHEETCPWRLSLKPHLRPPSLTKEYLVPLFFKCVFSWETSLRGNIHSPLPMALSVVAADYLLTNPTNQPEAAISENLARIKSFCATRSVSEVISLFGWKSKPESSKGFDRGSNASCVFCKKRAFLRVEGKYKQREKQRYEPPFYSPKNAFAPVFAKQKSFGSAGEKGLLIESSWKPKGKIVQRAVQFKPKRTLNGPPKSSKEFCGLKAHKRFCPLLSAVWGGEAPGFCFLAEKVENFRH